MQRDSFLSDNCPPMGIYETLYAFRDSFGKFMGSEGTHPWSQGFPLTTQLAGGPPLPSSVDVSWEDRFYPKAWGHPLLREAIANYYNSFYGSRITPENVMVFAGGRPGIYAVLQFLKKHVEVRIGNVEWPAYLDIMTQTNASWRVVPFTEANGFRPSNAEYFDRTGLNAKTHLMPIISNPGNPTGHTRAGAELEELIAMAEQPKSGILLDEAYEMFHPSKGVSGIRYVKDLDNSNVFLAGACTKGLQCPGIRIGWIIASKKNIETLSNFSSFGMGGVSHPSQLYAVKLLEPERVAMAREAVDKHYSMQRALRRSLREAGARRLHGRWRLLSLAAAAGRHGSRRVESPAFQARCRHPPRRRLRHGPPSHQRPGLRVSIPGLVPILLWPLVARNV